MLAHVYLVHVMPAESNNPNIKATPLGRLDRRSTMAPQNKRTRLAYEGTSQEMEESAS